MPRIKRIGSIIAIVLAITSLLCIINGVAGNYQQVKDRMDCVEKTISAHNEQLDSMSNQWNVVSQDIAVIKAILVRIEKTLDKITVPGS
jgi:uncharacterized protein YoxC